MIIGSIQHVFVVASLLGTLVKREMPCYRGDSCGLGHGWMCDTAIRDIIPIGQGQAFAQGISCSEAKEGSIVSLAGSFLAMPHGRCRFDKWSDLGATCP